jgi:ribonucleoside-diphosphate reductase beta chain
MQTLALIQALHQSHGAQNARIDQRASVMSDVVSGRIPLREVGEVPLAYLDLTRLPDVREDNILTASKVYKPFRYDYGYEMFLRQNQVIWLPEEVPMGQDVRDWKTKLNDAERNLMTHIFRLFTQNDMLINNAYIHQYARIFLPNELQMAFSSIANIESVHQGAYAHLLDSLSIPEVEYSAFMKYQAMADKYNFTAGFRMDTLSGIARAMLVFGMLTEGLQLFASFAVLLNFPRHNKLKGMGQVISWSVRDESAHCAFIAKLFKSFLGEFGHLIDMEKLRGDLVEIVNTVVANEDNFADLAFEMGPVEGMTAAEVKVYNRSIADMRLRQYGFAEQFGNPANPFTTWINKLTGGLEHANFFEQRASDYTKSATRGTWDEAYDPIPTTPVVTAEAVH